MRRWRIDAAPAVAEIEEIAALLRGGGLVLLPTDTIYGLHAIATDDAAIERLANAKGRDDAKPFVVIAADQRQLEEIGIAFAPEVRRTVGTLWPAPLTAVLPLSRPVAASRGFASLAVRVPKLAWLRELLTRTGPLASTSANLSGQLPISAPDELAKEVENSLSGAVDGGYFSGEPSTIVDFTGDEPRLIREGSPAFAQKVRKTLWKTL
jgi:L-threonylcarbamoyladenylate synthase